MLPGKYMGAIMFGNGLSGISLNLVRAICLITIPNDFYLGSLVYFILAACILVLCAFAQWKFQQLEFVKYYIKKATDEKMLSIRRISGIEEDFFAKERLIPPDSLNKTEGSHASSVLNEMKGNNYLPKA